MSLIQFATRFAGVVRLPFLPLAAACVAVGASISWWRIQEMDFILLGLVLIGAIASHMSVNALNEYKDFNSGLDLKTIKTPFSGGSGTLPNAPDFVNMAKYIGFATLALTVSLGLYFLYLRGPLLLLTGLPGILLVVTYTPHITRNCFWSLISSGLGFGPSMIMGTEYVLSGNYSWSGLIASMIVFFLVNNLLLINQFPDIEEDRSVGRKNILILWGPEKAKTVIALFFALSYSLLIFAATFQMLPPYSIAGLFTIPLALALFYGLRKHGTNIQPLMPYMGINVVITLLTPVLIASGVLLG